MGELCEPAWTTGWNAFSGDGDLIHNVAIAEGTHFFVLMNGIGKVVGLGYNLLVQIIPLNGKLPTLIGIGILGLLKHIILDLKFRFFCSELLECDLFILDNLVLFMNMINNFSIFDTIFWLGRAFGWTKGPFFLQVCIALLLHCSDLHNVLVKD